MMVETILESSQDFGMSNGSLPQWKRELLQRRAARSRPSLPPPQPPPPPPPPPAPTEDEDEELRYGPGIVKRLKSRYLSLALRDAPRRRPSVLRRATSLEHLLDERPPPTPAPRSSAAHARPPRPASVAAPPALYAPSPRRDSMKRAHSVDALSRLDARDEPRQPSPSPPPPPPAPRPPQLRAARPPRRPTPLLRETERPPPDVVRSTLRKFESAPTRRPAPKARVSAVLKGLEAPQRTSTPEPDAPEPTPRTPSPSTIAPLSPVPSVCESPPPSFIPSIPGPTETRQVSRAALEGIARAGSSTRYSFEAPRGGSHLPPLSATNPVLVGRARRIGVIRPMPAPALTRAESSPPRDEIPEKIEEVNGRVPSPVPEPEQAPPVRTERREPPPSAYVEPIPRVAPEPAREESPRPETPPPRILSPVPKPVDIGDPAPLVNGHGTTQHSDKVSCVGSKIVGAGIERAWSGSAGEGLAGPWGAQRRPRAPPPAATSVVFNFSNRKEVPDYIENDGIVLRANRRNRIKPGEPGVVVLRPEALVRPESDSEDEADCGPPSPCGVKFVNDNVVINGKSSMTAKPNRDRIAKLKLQFDDSLTRTFEYPSETSLCEETPTTPVAPVAPGVVTLAAPGIVTPASPAHPQCAESPLHATLAANTHITSAALSQYTPSKTLASSFQLGVTRHEPAMDAEKPPTNGVEAPSEEECGGDARPCGADAARSWSEARTHNTDLLF